MEALPETYGPDWTQLFLRDYLLFDKSLFIDTFDNDSNTSLSYLPTFDNLEKYANERGINGMKVFNYHSNPYQLKSFLFVIVCYGKRSWHDRAYFIEKIRAITDKYSQYKVTVFDYDATIFDLIITVKGINYA
uniref:Uncharacterized protein n=1 Tax=Panagrolaimus superbus TaxID=310955 RepID=A0A914Y7Z0_9BILA